MLALARDIPPGAPSMPSLTIEVASCTASVSPRLMGIEYAQKHPCRRYVLAGAPA